MTDSASPPLPFADAWRDLGRIVAAHVVMLRDAAILDDAVAAALLRAMDGVNRGQPAAVGSLTELIAAYDERLDALTPAGAAGASGVARGRAEVQAALLRMTLRDGLLGLLEATDGARHGLLDLAAAHVFTLMPAHSGGQAAQPTTFAHFLGGAIGPLGRATGRLRAAYAEANQSPLGAVALASTSLPVERERAAALLGFDGIVANTYDAVAAIDHVITAAEAAAGVTLALRRLVEELLTWLRTEPTSFRLDEVWVGPAADPGLPQLRPPVGLERLISFARRIEGDAASIARLAGEAPYGPAVAAIEALDEVVRRLLADGATLAGRVRDLVTTGLELNRAYLANRAGRGHTTSGDLADFLMLEEGLDPMAARNIAHLTVRKALDQGIEASGITPELIDGSALLVVGRELGVEAESIGRHLAPRRFIERRGAAGGPAPVATRAYLDAERARLDADDWWRAETAARLTAAREDLERAGAEIMAGVD